MSAKDSLADGGMYLARNVIQGFQNTDTHSPEYKSAQLSAIIMTTTALASVGFLTAYALHRYRLYASQDLKSDQGTLEKSNKPKA